MKRRTFLKAMGITGLLSATNWRTLIAGPKDTDFVVSGVFKKTTTAIGVAGEPLFAGQILFLHNDGTLRPCRTNLDTPVRGISLAQAQPGETIKILTSGHYMSFIQPKVPSTKRSNR